MSNPHHDDFVGGDWARPLASPRLVVIAASAGGLAAITGVLSSLPPDFPAAIAVVQHRGLEHPHLLPELLAKRTGLTVRHARDGEPLRAGTVYVCPPGMHMTAEQCVRLIEGPRLQAVRPNADLMLRSAARAYADRAIGVVLSGNGSDGTAGCLAIAQAGGTVIVQEASTCAFEAMPAAVARLGVSSLSLPPAEIGVALNRLVAHAPHRVPPPAAPIRVLLVDDHRMLRDGLAVLLQAERDIEVIGEAENGRAAVHLAAELTPDVVIMDVAMPGLDGVQATRQIVESAPLARVVALSARSDVKTVVDILRAGASGYLTKQAAFDELALAIRAVMADENYFSADIAASSRGEHGSTAGGGSPGVSISSHEREVLRSTAAGKTSKQIAADLGISSKAVARHRRRLMTKLAIDSVAGLTKYAIREGLASTEA